MVSLPISEQLKIDWQAPWLTHLPTAAYDAAHAQDLKITLNAHVADLSSGSGCALRFIAQEALPVNVAYETHIFNTGGVPTRLNLHDFFNATIWLTFPRTKAVLNARQAEQIEKLGVQHERGVARDALTLFDENAAILVTCAPSLAHALREFDWHNTFVSTRSLWDSPFKPRSDAKAALYPFGHALLEKLTEPYKAICAHTWVVHVTSDWFKLPLAERLTELDARLAQQLKHIEFNPRDFCPLPILGVPHFWADNRDESFYNDARVFRSGRTRLQSKDQ